MKGNCLMRSTKPKFGNSRKVALLAAVAASVLLGNSVFAMTFDELQAAVNDAEPGATVYVTSDMDVTGTLSCSKQITIRSSPGTTNVLSFTDAGLSKIFLDAGSGTDVTFADLTIDGRYEALTKKSTDRFMSIHDGGKVTFDSGFTFKDYYCGISATISIRSNGLLTMNEGTVLRGLQNDMWGTAVYLNGGSSAQKARFVMTGGMIADCKGHGAADQSTYVDGVVYVNSGNAGSAVFTMTGGTISGNTSDHKTAGVYVTRDETKSFYVAGAAFVTNNVGAVGNDVYIDGAGSRGAMPQFIMTGDYIGCMTIYISNGAPAPSGQQQGVYEGRAAFGGCEGKYTGGGNIEVTAAGCETLVVDAYTQATSGLAVFSRRAARVGPKGERGVFVCSFKEAFAVVQDGDQISLTTNLNMTTQVNLSSATTRSGATDFTLCSDAGGPYRITWDVADYDGNAYLFLIDNRPANTTFRLRIENLVFDGRSDTSKCRLFRLAPYSTLQLGNGAVIENIWNNTDGRNGAAVGINKSDLGPARLEMEEGSVIRNCSTRGSGSAIHINKNLAGTLAFVMRGGVISNNVSLASGVGGGALNLAGGYLIEMTGGEIVGNRSENGIAGVYIDNGSMTVSGFASITNNTGYYNDAYLRYGTGKMVMRGDFRGSIGVSGSRQQTLGNEFCTDAESGATGAWCFHAVGQSPAQPNMIGTRDGNVLKWALATGTVGGRGIVADEEMQAAVATGVSNLTQNARATLPLMLGGRATELTYEVALDFDGEELYESGELPLVLCSPEDGYALTGRLTASCPEDDKYSWSVRTVNGSYVLMGRLRQGLSIFVR